MEALFRVTPPWLTLEDDAIGVPSLESLNVDESKVCKVEPPWYRGSEQGKDEKEYIYRDRERQAAQRNINQARKRAITSLHTREIEANNKLSKEYKALRLKEQHQEVAFKMENNERLYLEKQVRKGELIAEKARLAQTELDQKKKALNEYLRKKNENATINKIEAQKQSEKVKSEIETFIIEKQIVRAENRDENKRVKRYFEEKVMNLKQYKEEQYKSKLFQKKIEEFYVQKELEDTNKRAQKLSNVKKTEQQQQRERFEQERIYKARNRAQMHQDTKNEEEEAKQRQIIQLQEKYERHNLFLQQEKSQVKEEQQSNMQKINLIKQRRKDIYCEERTQEEERLKARLTTPLQLRAKLGQRRREEEKKARDAHQASVEAEISAKNQKRAMLKLEQKQNNNDSVKSLIFG